MGRCRIRVLIFALREERVLSRLIRAFGITLTVAYATYLLFPVYFERPLLVVDSVATFLLSLELRERRWLSVARDPSRPTVSGWAIHERVSFGAVTSR